MARKITYYKFGTEDYPLPVLRGDKIEWLASESDGILLPTMREDDQDRLYGELIRNCVPDTGMLPIFEEMLVRFDPIRANAKIKSYNYQILGTPGAGKTYIMKQVAKLVHPKGALVFECKQHQQNPEEVYKVTTFNVEQANKQSAIDGKLLVGNIHPEVAISQNTVTYLKKMLGNDVVTQETREGRKITAVDWNAVNKPSDYLDVVLSRVCEMEHIDIKDNGNAMGFKVQNGPLLNALLNPDHPDYGRIVLLDESNRMPELYDIISFFSDANIDKITLKGEDDTEFTIRRKDLPPTFMLYETGNDAVEGMGDDVNVMSKPALSRKAAGIDIETIPVPDRNDYIARAAKHMTGVPAMQIYLSQEEYFKQHPDELVNTLMYMRTVGLTKAERAAIPRGEILNIRNFEKTKQVCASYGALMHKADELISEEIHKGEQSQLPDRYREYLETKALVDLRYVFKLLQHSEIVRPQSTKEIGGIFKALGQKTKKSHPVDINEEKFNENAYMSLMNRGTQLENEIGTKLKDLFLPRNLAILLQGDNYDSGKQAVEVLWSNLLHFAKGLNFEFAGYVNKDSIAKLYNVDAENLPEFEAATVQKILLQSLQQEYKEELSGCDIENQNLLNEEVIISALEMIKEKPVGITVPNFELETINENPLKQVFLLNAKKGTTINPENLINTNQFADSFIISKLRANNLRQYWKDRPQIDSENISASQKSYEIAAGNHPKIAVTTVLVNDYGRTGAAHIIHNKEKDNTIILSDFEISDEDKKGLSKSNVFFTNITDNLTDKKISQIELACSMLLRETECTVGDVAGAVMVRIAPDLADPDQSIKDLCLYLNGMSKSQELPPYASQITNINYRSDMSADTVLAMLQQTQGERK